MERKQRKGSNTQHNNHTNMTSASSSPTKHHPRTVRHTHPPTTPPTQPTHSPCYSSMIHEQIDALFRTRTSREQSGYIAETTKYCCCTKETAPPPTGTNALTHARNDRHPPTQPTARQPINPSYHQPLRPICATAVQQYSGTAAVQLYVPAGTYTSKHRRLVRTRFFTLKTQSMRTLHLQRSTKRVNHPFSPIHRPTTHPRTGTGTYCCMVKIHVPSIITPTTKTKHPR